MSREIIPIFAEVAEKNQKAAEALSEPFVTEPDVFGLAAAGNIFDMNAENLVAAGVTYVDAEPDYDQDEEVSLHDLDSDAVGIQDYFFMKSGLKRPYQAFQSFVQGYSSTIHPLQKYGHRVEQVCNDELGLEDANGELLDDTIDAAMKAGLRTIGTFALFRVGVNERQVHGLFVPETIIKQGYVYREQMLESGLSIDHPEVKDILALSAKVSPERSLAEIRASMVRIFEGHPNLRAFGPYLAAIAMERGEVAEANMSNHPELQMYQKMSRAELREALKAERKAEQKQRRDAA